MAGYYAPSSYVVGYGQPSMTTRAAPSAFLLTAIPVQAYPALQYAAARPSPVYFASGAPSEFAAPPAAYAQPPVGYAYPSAGYAPLPVGYAPPSVGHASPQYQIAQHAPAPHREQSPSASGPSAYNQPRQYAPPTPLQQQGVIYNAPPQGQSYAVQAPANQPSLQEKFAADARHRPPQPASNSFYQPITQNKRGLCADSQVEIRDLPNLFESRDNDQRDGCEAIVKLEPIESPGDEDNRGGSDNDGNTRYEIIQRCISFIVHASTCAEANCLRDSCRMMKRVVQHTKMCKKRANASCPFCKQLIALCCYHAKHCNRDGCSVPFCMNIRQKLHEQLRRGRKRRHVGDHPAIPLAAPPLTGSASSDLSP